MKTSSFWCKSYWQKAIFTYIFDAKRNTVHNMYRSQGTWAWTHYGAASKAKKRKSKNSTETMKTFQTGIQDAVRLSATAFETFDSCGNGQLSTTPNFSFRGGAPDTRWIRHREHNEARFDSVWIPSDSGSPQNRLLDVNSARRFEHHD